MKNESWSISSKDHVNYDDDETIVPRTNPNPNEYDEEEEEENEEQEVTVKPSKTFNSARDKMIERKMQQADARGNQFKYAKKERSFVR